MVREGQGRGRVKIDLLKADWAQPASAPSVMKWVTQWLLIGAQRAVGIIQLDLSKTFVMISHGILLATLRDVNWIESIRWVEKWLDQQA